MSETRCAELVLLIQADIDGELDAGQAAMVAAHVATCAACRTTQQRLVRLSGRVRTELAYHPAPAKLREAVLARVAAASAAPAVSVAEVTPPGTGPLWRRLGRPGRPGMAFGGGFALAAAIGFLMLLPGGGGDNLADAVVAGHIRALQPGHLTDVISTDQHTVKPWFDGRLDYAPPVRDFAAQGYPLTGGRLDYLDGHPVAALVYGRDKHLIDLFVWPRSRSSQRNPGEGSRDGYNYVRWIQDDMVFWAVSDVNQKELDDFARLWSQD